MSTRNLFCALSPWAGASVCQCVRVHCMNMALPETFALTSPYSFLFDFFWLGLASLIVHFLFLVPLQMTLQIGINGSLFSFDWTIYDEQTILISLSIHKQRSARNFLILYYGEMNVTETLSKRALRVFLQRHFGAWRIWLCWRASCCSVNQYEYLFNFGMCIDKWLNLCPSFKSQITILIGFFDKNTQ